MNDVQKLVMCRMSDDDVVSVQTLCTRLHKLVTQRDLKGLEARDLVEPGGRPFVWKLTRKGRRAAREARRELDRTYEPVQVPSPMLEVQRQRAKPRPEHSVRPVSTFLRMKPEVLAAFLREDGSETTTEPA